MPAAVAAPPLLQHVVLSAAQVAAIRTVVLRHADLASDSPSQSLPAQGLPPNPAVPPLEYTHRLLVPLPRLDTLYDDLVDALGSASHHAAAVESDSDDPHSMSIDPDEAATRRQQQRQHAEKLARWLLATLRFFAVPPEWLTVQSAAAQLQRARSSRLSPTRTAPSRVGEASGASGDHTRPPSAAGHAAGSSPLKPRAPLSRVASSGALDPSGLSPGDNASATLPAVETVTESDAAAQRLQAQMAEINALRSVRHHLEGATRFLLSPLSAHAALQKLEAFDASLWLFTIQGRNGGLHAAAEKQWGAPAWLETRAPRGRHARYAAVGAAHAHIPVSSRVLLRALSKRFTAAQIERTLKVLLRVAFAEQPATSSDATRATVVRWVTPFAAALDAEGWPRAAVQEMTFFLTFALTQRVQRAELVQWAERVRMKLPRCISFRWSYFVDLQRLLATWLTPRAAYALIDALLRMAFMFAPPELLLDPAKPEFVEMRSAEAFTARIAEYVRRVDPATSPVLASMPCAAKVELARLLSFSLSYEPFVPSELCTRGHLAHRLLIMRETLLAMLTTAVPWDAAEAMFQSSKQAELPADGTLWQATPPVGIKRVLHLLPDVLHHANDGILDESSAPRRLPVGLVERILDRAEEGDLDARPPRLDRVRTGKAALMCAVRAPRWFAVVGDCIATLLSVTPLKLRAGLARCVGDHMHAAHEALQADLDATTAVSHTGHDALSVAAPVTDAIAHVCGDLVVQESSVLHDAPRAVHRVVVGALQQLQAAVNASSRGPADPDDAPSHSGASTPHGSALNPFFLFEASSIGMSESVQSYNTPARDRASTAGGTARNRAQRLHAAAVAFAERSLASWYVALGELRLQLQTTALPSCGLAEHLATTGNVDAALQGVLVPELREEMALRGLWESAAAHDAVSRLQQLGILGEPALVDDVYRALLPPRRDAPNAVTVEEARELTWLVTACSPPHRSGSGRATSARPASAVRVASARRPWMAAVYDSGNHLLDVTTAVGIISAEVGTSAALQLDIGAMEHEAAGDVDFAASIQSPSRRTASPSPRAKIPRPPPAASVARDRTAHRNDVVQSANADAGLMGFGDVTHSAFCGPLLEETFDEHRDVNGYVASRVLLDAIDNSPALAASPPALKAELVAKVEREQKVAFGDLSEYNASTSAWVQRIREIFGPPKYFSQQESYSVVPYATYADVMLRLASL